MAFIRSLRAMVDSLGVIVLCIALSSHIPASDPISAYDMRLWFFPPGANRASTGCESHLSYSANEGTTNSANPPLTWAKTYGGAAEDFGRAIAPTRDGGYVVAGTTKSFGSGPADAWVLKLDVAGHVVWQKTYGGSGSDGVLAIAPNAEGGFVLAGATNSFRANIDATIVKIDAVGTVLWQKSYAGNLITSIVSTSDSGYIATGYSGFYGAGNTDVWVLKIDESGNVQWQKAYGGSSYDYAYSISSTGDGGYIVAGSSQSFGAGNNDMWVIKLDGNGNVMWQKAYGRFGDEIAYAVVPVSADGYLVAGTTNSSGAGSLDNLILRLDGAGNIIWQKTYGRSGDDYAYSVLPTSDGGFVVAGSTSVYLIPRVEAWLLKLDAVGNVMWQKKYGGNANEFRSIIRAADGGFALAGVTILFGAGLTEFSVFKVDQEGSIGDTTYCPIIRHTSVQGIDSAVVASSTTLLQSDLPGSAAVISMTVNDTTVIPQPYCRSYSSYFPLVRILE